MLSYYIYIYMQAWDLFGQIMRGALNSATELPLKHTRTVATHRGDWVSITIDSWFESWRLKGTGLRVSCLIGQPRLHNAAY